MSHRQNSRLARKGGFSLIESVVTVALVGIIVIGVVPLFGRAILNNTYGADASQLTAFSRTGLETLLQRTGNSNTFLADATTDGSGGSDPFNSDSTVLRFAPSYYDQGARRTYGTDDRIGDEQWITDPTAADGSLLWRAFLEKREFGYSDVHFGTVSVEGGAIAQTGHPKLFDTPLPILDSSGNQLATFSGGEISELRMIVESLRGAQLGDAATANTTVADRAAMTATGMQQRVSVSTFHVF